LLDLLRITKNAIYNELLANVNRMKQVAIAGMWKK